ncbi:candidate G-protein alpha subunit [Postia placenta Mad-698-R]|nr:candidate G-protein alpha subunit [Postia placenta Mad-698-R]
MLTSPSTLDPLDVLLSPPADESTEERVARLSAEAEAKKISDMIDEELQRQERAEKRGQKPIKILLLGESQLSVERRAFRAERASWRAVIHLNVVRSIRVILEAMAEAQTAQRSPEEPSAPPRVLPSLTAEHLKLKMRLSPLVQVEQALVRKLTPPGSTEFEATHLTNVSNYQYTPRTKEVAVNSQFAWKHMFSRFLPDSRDSMDSEEGINWDDPQDPGRIIYACGEDMIRLWNDETIKALLKSLNIRLADQPGFFLDCLDRVTSPRYVPTDDDILRARLKTLGVTEYRFTIKEGTLGGVSRDWKIFDVGGHRSLVAAWAPYFDDMNAIIFLAPISCFDQMLEEDPTVNRLEDSVLLWKSIVSNPLLAKTSIVLFLNKIDIFKAKLEAGVQLGKYIVSYGNRPNDFESTSSCESLAYPHGRAKGADLDGTAMMIHADLKRKFAQIHKDKSPELRSFYCHFTTVTNTKSTQHILFDVQDTVVVKNLKNSSLIS